MSESAHGILMIDVGGKPVTVRTARAAGRLLAQPETIRRIREGGLEKGDAIATARIAVRAPIEWPMTMGCSKISASATASAAIASSV